MNWIDVLQVTIAFSALGLQVWATVLSSPLKEITPPRVWHALIVLNFFIMIRRTLSVLEVAYDWNGQTYESTAVLIGLSISILMLTTIVRLRAHLRFERENELRLQTEARAEREKARLMITAALEFAEELKRRNYRVEDTDAYKLALKFSEKQ